MNTAAYLLAKLGLHVDQNTWATYAGKLLGVVALIAGGLLCPADILMAGFGISVSAATETCIVWWCVAIGVVSGYMSAHATDRRTPASVQSPTGGGMTARLLAVAGVLGLVLSLPACAALSGLRPGTSGYTRAQVATLLSDASWGLKEGCSVGWVPADVCGDVQAGLQTALDIAQKAPQATLRMDVAAGLARLEDRLPADSRAIQYIHYVRVLLEKQS